MLREFSGDLIQWLRGFYYTATCGNMTSAMKHMNRNQSALTYQIKSLEKEFGVKLFSGARNNRVLTDEGRFLLSRASQLFSFINALSEQLTNLPTEVRGELHITSMFSFYNHIMPQLVEKFAQKNSEVLFRLHPCTFEKELFEQISSGSADMGILASARIPDELFSLPLFKTDLVLITPQRLRLNPAAITLEDISALELGASPLKSSLWLNISLQCRRYGVTLKPKHIIDQQDCLLRCVESGLCSAILDGFVVEDLASPRLNVYSLKKIFRPRQYYLIMQKDSPYQYPQIKAFYSFLLHEFEITDFMEARQ